MTLIAQITICVVMVALGGFFSGSETGVYRLSRFAMRLGVQQKRRFYFLLDSIMADSGGLVFSILIANNLVNYLATSIVTVILLTTSAGSHAAVFATMIMTPLLFIFSEVIPKNIYYHQSDTLMPRFAPLLWFFHKLFTVIGAVALLKALSRLTGKLAGSQFDTSGALTASSRSHIKQIIHETREEGILSSVQNDIMNRLINIPRINLNSVKTPLPQTRMLDINSNREMLIAELKECPHTRFPVYQQSRDSIIGFINIYEVLAGNAEFDDLKAFIKPIEAFDSTIPVIEAIDRVQRQGHKIILVCRTSGRKKTPVGIATMKDLVEELTGELAQW